MAVPGVPKGGKYPSRQELDALLGSLAGPGSQVPTSDLNVDRRTSYGRQAGRIYSDQLDPRDQNDVFLPRNTTSRPIGGVQPGDVLNAGAYYNPTEYENYNPATDEQIDAAGGDAPAFVQWDVPTSSTNYSRPRTVAAGYDASRQTMTVVFRDGTFYNYYEVTPAEWAAFYASYSKGKPWLNRKSKSQAVDGLFINKPRGYAGDMSNLDPQIAQALYRVARTQQVKTQPKQGRTAQTVYKTGRPGFYGLEDSPRGKKRQTMSVPNRVGRNPNASAGRNPSANAGRQRRAS